MKNLARIGIMLALPLSCLFTTSCNERGTTFTTRIVEDVGNQPFFNISLECTDKAMRDNGYLYGDIVTVTAKATNGNIWTCDLPYVTNYNEAGTFGPCLCDYESLNKPLQISPGFKVTGIVENNYYIGGTCEIKMKKADGYYEKRNLARVTTKLTFEECGYENTKYANCRDVINVGKIDEKIKANSLYRGSSPIAQSKNKERYIPADNYLNYHEINYDISLSLSITQLKNIMEKESDLGPYFKTLYDEHSGRIKTINLGNDFCRIKENEGDPDMGGDMVRDMFEYIAAKDRGESFFIHCNEGKDRTGFVVMVIEALCGVSLDDLVADYMLTFCNYYNITKINNKEKYDVMANLTCYRNLYAFMIDEDDGNKRFETLSKIDMLTFDSKKEVEKLMANKSEDYLQQCAVKYLKSIKLDGDLTTGTIKDLKDKFALNI